MKNEQIGILIILGGIAVLGFVYFKRNKPKTAEQQLSNLTAQGNDLKNTINTIDVPFYKPYADLRPANETTALGMPNITGILDNFNNSMQNLVL